MADKLINLLKLDKNRNAQIIIDVYSKYIPPKATSAGSGTRNTIKGYITQPLSIGGSNEFDSPFLSSAQESAGNILRKVGGFASMLTGGSVDIARYSMKSFHQTASVWTGSARPSFSLQFVFISVKENDDVRDKVKLLLSTVYPTQEKSLLNMMTPPIGYGFEYGEDKKKALPKTSIALKVGKWFQATQLIAKDCSFEFSKEVTKNGSPLYATGTYTLEPFRMISADELMKYFV